MTAPTWLVLGASSPIARAFAREAASRGARVILAGRDLEDLEHTAADVRIRQQTGAEVIPFDAIAYDTHDAFARACASGAEGELNVFLAFGVMDDQAAIDRDFALARRTIEGTYVGAVSVLARLAPELERRGRGRVCVLGSVAGDRGRPKNYVYGSAKAGLHAYLQGLRARLYKAGVTVTTIKPGFVDTTMTFGRPGVIFAVSPEVCARACYGHAMRGREVAYVPGFWRVVMAVVGAIPERVFKRLEL